MDHTTSPLLHIPTPLHRPRSPIVNLDTYLYKYLNSAEITPEELFTEAYVYEVYESEHVCTATKRLRVILDAKY